MNVNLLHDLLGKTFERKMKTIGHDVEVLCGGTINCRPEADFDNWEVKSRRLGSVSRISLGGMKNVSYEDLVSHVYEKVKNIVFVHYVENSDGTFTVVQITLFFGLEKSVFECGNYVEFDPHHRNNTLRITETKLYKMFGRKNVIYAAPQWAQ